MVALAMPTQGAGGPWGLVKDSWLDVPLIQALLRLARARVAAISPGPLSYPLTNHPSSLNHIPHVPAPPVSSPVSPLPPCPLSHHVPSPTVSPLPPCPLSHRVPSPTVSPLPPCLLPCPPSPLSSHPLSPLPCQSPCLLRVPSPHVPSPPTSSLPPCPLLHVPSPLSVSLSPPCPLSPIHGRGLTPVLSPTGYREGFLWKRGRDNGQFLSRKFVLTEREGALKYFNRNDAKEPKAVMKIEHLNATFQPAKIGHPHGLQVTYLKDNSTRNIFIYHEDGKEIVDWFNALRAARFHYLQVAFPGASDADLVPKLSRNYLKEGYMEKTGPKQTEGFRKRWFTMDDRRLMYFKDPLDAFARGEVFIGSKESGYTVLHGFPPSTQGHHWPHGITIVTPDRKFLFACETESDQREWVAAFQKAVDRPMLPQEYAVEAHFKHKP
uniref:ArfGAP with dual PH domains 1 n=3 Tax=Catarrhini TaxID=9526 RepID=A0A5F7ZQZ5_MACMU